MSLSPDERAIMTKSVLVETPSAGAADGYGNTGTLWTAVGTYRGFIERLEAGGSGGEPQEEGGRDTGVVEWLAIVEGVTADGVEVIIGRLDRIVIDGRRFSISLVEFLVGPSGDPHHYELICVEVS